LLARPIGTIDVECPWLSARTNTLFCPPIAHLYNLLSGLDMPLYPRYFETSNHSDISSMSIGQLFQNRARGIGRAYYPLRLIGFGICIAVLLMDRFGRGSMEPIHWLFASVWFVMPHISFLWYKASNSNKRVELTNLIMDTFWAGTFVNLVEFAYTPSMTLVAMTLAGNMGVKGFRQFGYGLVALAVGIGFAGVFNGFTFNENVSFLVNAMSSVFLVLYIGIFAYSSLLERKRLKKAKAEVAAKNQELMDSIHYAQTMQQAMMRLDRSVMNRLAEHFVLFRPRDVVSGDFYWVAQQDNKLIVAAIDCTGHGVPGAFMSMLGSELLNNIVKDKGITEPDQILNRLHRGVNKALSQDHSTSRDGMDLCLCTIDYTNGALHFAGAMNPMYCLQEGILNELRPDKMPIGGSSDANRTAYTKQTVLLDTDTTIYLCSDGFQDQFGGPKGKKFLRKRFRQMLLEIHSEPMAHQKVHLSYVLDEWMAGHEQTDDILVMGIRLPAMATSNSVTAA